MTPVLSSEQLEIQSLAREFAESELRPHAHDRDARGWLEDEVFGQLAELGFMGMLIPEEHGGLGFDLTTYVLVLEELARGDAAVALSVAIHNGPVATVLGDHATAEQKARWMPALATGATLGTFAFAGPRSGTDGPSLEARPDGAGWRVDGAVGWVANGSRAGLVVLVAPLRGGGSAVFLMAPDRDQYTVGRRERTLGLRAAELVTLELSDVAVGRDALVGEAGPAFEYASDALGVGRIGVAAQSLGIGRAAMEYAGAYSLDREQFGAPIASFGAIQGKLGSMAERLAAGRALALEAAAALQVSRTSAANGDGGLTGVTARAAIAKLVASEAATWSADEAIQVFGGYGYMRHYPVEKLLRDAKGMEIYQGTNEALRRVVARELLTDLEQTAGSTR